MNSDTYNYRRGKIKLLSNEIAIRGFAREFKSKLLKGKNFSLTKPEYKDVRDAFLKAYVEKPVDYTFIESSAFSKWWKGTQFPTPEHKEAIEEVFPNLLKKWFDRKKFVNRMQLHLASMDLFSLSRKCNCKKEIEEDVEFEQHCEKCFEIAVDEAEKILQKIHEDWRPTHTGRWNMVDLCISGPNERSGVNIVRNRFEEAFASVSKFIGKKPKEKDIRENVDYNLDLFETSFIGLPLPREINKAYQDGNPLSVCTFLLTIIGLNLKSQSEYRDDLILDFLTSLNCASLILFKRHNGYLSHDRDYIDEKLQEIFFEIINYFFEDEQKTLVQNLQGFESAVENLLASNEKNKQYEYDMIIQPITHISSNPCFKLSKLITELVADSLAISEDKTLKYIKNLKELSNKADTIDVVDDYISENFMPIYRSVEQSRDRYFKLLKITGYTQEEIRIKLRKMIQSPANTTIRPGTSEWQKPSPYSH